MVAENSMMNVRLRLTLYGKKTQTEVAARNHCTRQYFSAVRVFFAKSQSLGCGSAGHVCIITKIICRQLVKCLERLINNFAELTASQPVVHEYTLSSLSERKEAGSASQMKEQIYLH